MSTFITVVHILTAVFLIGFVLIQSGKGAEISASFAGSSQTVFGSSGGANFFTRATGVLAGIFMLTSLGLTIISNKSRKSVFEGVTPPPAAQTAPAVPPAAPEQGQTKAGDATPADAADKTHSTAPAKQ